MAENDFSGNYMETFGQKGEAVFHTPTRLTSFEKSEDGQVMLTCENGVKLAITILEDGLLRFRYAPDGRFPDDFSYALDERFQPVPAEFDIIEFGDGIAIQTRLLSIRISRENLKTRITHRLSGRTLCEDSKGFEWLDNRAHGGDVVRMSKKSRRGENFYGLGDKSCDLNLRERKFSLWGSDTYGYGVDTDPLYKNIPFYVSVQKGMSYGVFFDNTFRTEFDFAHAKDDEMSFAAPGGEMNYYFFHADTPLEVVALYTRLTGLPEMPPLWALAYHQCKWSYYPEANVREICAGFRERQIPCDAIYLDIDYMDGYRCFTWDAERFPDPKKMVADLEEDGFKTVAMIDPGLKIDETYDIWRQGYEKDYYCRRMDGAHFKGSVWPGLCHFPDFTNADVREWWADLYKEFMEDIGLRGIWNDMNEPAVFEDGTMPDDVRFHFDGHPCSHRKAHNIYGMQMVRATYEGLRRHSRGRRPFAITRSCYAGTQRFSSAWTGDNLASWDHLKMANRQCQRMATSGMSFIGSDIGGFIETPSAELYGRWMQLGAWHPFFRTHSSGDHGEQEPWSFGPEAEAMAKSAIELRYQLLPVHYTAFWQYATRGTPILRSLPLMEPGDPDVYWRAAEFGLGDNLYIVPVTAPAEDNPDERDGKQGRTLYLPEGQWFDYWTDEKMSTVREDIWVGTTEDHILTYVKAGSVLPHWPIQQYIGEIEHPTPVLHIWPTATDLTSEWYEDSGDHFTYENGDYRASCFTVAKTENGTLITRTYEGDWKPGYTGITLCLRAFPELTEVLIDGEKVSEFSTNENGHITLSASPDFKTVSLLETAKA